MRAAGALAVMVAAVGGCTPARYAEQADRDAFSTVRETHEFAFGTEATFRAAYESYRRSDDAPGEEITVAGVRIPLDGNDVRRLTLAESLRIAFHNSRDYQTRREELYTAALALANARRGWDFPLVGGTIEGAAGREVVNREGETNSGELAPELTLTQQLVHGGVFTLGASVELLSDMLGWQSTTLGSLLSANFTQPLLQGGWRGLAYEEQYRLERDFVFSVLEFERFTQEFAVATLADYYNVLQQRDQLANTRENINRLKDTLALTKTLVAGGLKSRIEEDQAEQNLLQAQVRYQQDLQRYEDTLDRFKLSLGLPIASRVEGNYPEALVELNRGGPRPVPVAEADALGIAMRTRPDVLRSFASVRDADRDVVIAADAFLPILDVTLGISAAGTEPRRAGRIQFHRHTRYAALGFSYELDQTDNRDAYRLAMIARDRAARDHREFLDALALDIRRSYRALVQSRRSYRLQLRNVEIAKRRSKLAVLQQKEGEASARDVLEAEEALRQAQNGVTDALISYTTTRLEFLTTLGMIRVDDEGNLHERSEPVQYDRVERRYPHAAGR